MKDRMLWWIFAVIAFYVTLGLLAGCSGQKDYEKRMDDFESLPESSIITNYSNHENFETWTIEVEGCQMLVTKAGAGNISVSSIRECIPRSE